MVLGIVFIAGCTQQSPQNAAQSAPSDQGRPPTVSEQCPSQYDGTYQGIFTYNYKTPIKDANGRTIDYKVETSGVRLSVTLECDLVYEEGVLLKVTHVIASHPDFGCQVGGCTPLQNPPSNAFLPLEGTSPGASSASAMGLFIAFPNGYQLFTNGQPGALYVSMGGQVLSNSLDPSIQGYSYSVLSTDGPSSFPSEVRDKDGTYMNDFAKSWTLSKTT
ncbi:hypothetical protein COV19_02145 [Candidatus Woesearchaeota archaeon CG10_big_fil_rev_8_21_14_0_10_44_13]|nr:MAG: hypothetical protein COV19_02145 [Candidatus Woesearchaeota archaeon CG10_big_fil_rev_8_21_14_0_10_44_13]